MSKEDRMHKDNFIIAGLELRLEKGKAIWQLGHS